VDKRREESGIRFYLCIVGSISNLGISYYMASYHIAPTAQTDLVRTCFTFLKHLGKASSLVEETTAFYPFADYTARYWYAHAKKAEDNLDSKNEKTYVRALGDFTSHENVFVNSIRLSDPHHARKINLRQPKNEMAEPLYYMALTGIDLAVSFLIFKKGASVNSTNKYSPTFSALEAAFQKGHHNVVRVLLEHPEVSQNERATAFGKLALQMASGRGHQEVVQLLLGHAPELKFQREEYDTALSVASSRGHLEMVHMLLDKGADVYAQSQHDNALQAGSSRGHGEIIQILS
jgi:Ankyrin repeats (3 copies)